MKHLTMLTKIKIYLLFCVSTLMPVIVNAQTDYAPTKVVYDVAGANATELSHIIDRITLLQNIYQHDAFDASIILVIHEGAIPLLTNKNPNNHALLQRVKSLTLGEIVQFRLCEASANRQGFYGKDFDSFIQLVPMADAEIIALQNKGYAYLK